MEYLGPISTGLGIYFCTAIIPKAKKTKYFLVICIATVLLFTALFYYMTKHKYEMPWPIVIGFFYGLLVLLPGIFFDRDKSKAAEKNSHE
jgi:RsiW-degrading membrane proteinase PrsW (M82 family)